MEETMKTIKYGINVFLISLILTFFTPLMAQPVNINTADAQTIADNLNGIGLKKAEAIIVWRSEHGNFKDLANLENVKGIGHKTLEKNKDDIQF